MNWFKRIYNQDKFKFLFVLTMIIIAVAFVLALIIVPIIFGSYREMFVFIKYFLFADMGQYFYFSVIDNPFVSEFSTIYFPLGILMMKPFALFSKNAVTIDMLKKGNGDYTHPILSDEKSFRVIDMYNAELLNNPGFWVGILLYYAITLTLIGVLAYKMYNWKSKKHFFYAFALFCFTGPFVVGFFRGTNVFTALLLIMCFLYFRNSEKRLLREFSLICLVVAGVVRLYPFLFGAVLLREKRFLDSAKVCLYAVIFALVPFLFYEQPFETMRAYFTNLTSFVGSDGRLKDAMNLSVYSMLGYIFYLFGVTNAIVIKVISLTATISAFILSASVGIFAKQKYVRYMAIVCGMALVTPVAYYYLLMFLIIPILAFMQEGDKVDANRKKIYIVMFLFLMFIVTSVVGWYLIQTTLMFTLLVYEFYMLIKERKNTKCEEINQSSVVAEE